MIETLPETDTGYNPLTGSQVADLPNQAALRSWQTFDTCFLPVPGIEIDSINRAVGWIQRGLSARVDLVREEELRGRTPFNSRYTGGQSTPQDVVQSLRNLSVTTDSAAPASQGAAGVASVKQEAELCGLSPSGPLT